MRICAGGGGGLRKRYRSRERASQEVAYARTHFRFGRAAVYFLPNKVGFTPQRPDDTKLTQDGAPFQLLFFCLIL